MEGCRCSHQVKTVVGQGGLLGGANHRYEIRVVCQQFFRLGAHVRVGLYSVNLRPQPEQLTREDACARAKISNQ